MANIHTHYDNLKVTRDAPVSVIKAAYKALCQTFHPDKFQGSTEEAERVIKLVNASYAVLIDPDKRAKHNAWIKEQEAKQGDKPQFDETDNSTEPPYSEKRDTQREYSEPPPSSSVKDMFQRAYDLQDQGRYAEAFKLYQYLADQDYADAQFKLGLMYELGQGVSQGYTQAVYWYLKAAEQGNTNARYNLALKYQAGLGVTQDATKAAYWFGKAAEQGNS
jgi:TPR repeat protein